MVHQITLPIVVRNQTINLVLMRDAEEQHKAYLLTWQNYNKGLLAC